MNGNIKGSLFSIFFTIILTSECYGADVGPFVIATKGEVWPKPQTQEKSNEFFVLQTNSFTFEIIGQTCELLQNATDIYAKIISDETRTSDNSSDDDNYLGFLSTLSINISGSCANSSEWPSLDMDETYTLNITKDGANLTAETVWGIMRGLESFSQSVYIQDDNSIRINATNITDYPRFPHRGLMIDTARHYIPVEYLYLTLDAMAYNKMNVFHWHISDDQSFPYVSTKFTELSEGAYKATSVYNASAIQNIIYYARNRGIRVIPEFDTPGHTESWGVSHPELLTTCYDNGEPSGTYGPIDPSKNETYTFMEEFFEEITEAFPDQYIHLGGDEVSYDCWKTNSNITEFMEEKNIAGLYASLEGYYVEKIINITGDLNSTSIVWEEVFTNGADIPEDTIVHVWKELYVSTLRKVTQSGRRVLLSTCWYLDNLLSGGDWIKFYLCEPYLFTFNTNLRSLVIGGEATMFGEVVNQYNLIPRVWPRASAAAEKLWSDVSVFEILDAQKRLEEHVCRMNRRGIAAQPPNGPGYCP